MSKNASEQTTDRREQISRISQEIYGMDDAIAKREEALKTLRKERSKLVAKRFRLQKAEGLV